MYIDTSSLKNGNTMDIKSALLSLKEKHNQGQEKNETDINTEPTGLENQAFVGFFLKKKNIINLSENIELVYELVELKYSAEDEKFIVSVDKSAIETEKPQGVKDCRSIEWRADDVDFLISMIPSAYSEKISYFMIDDKTVLVGKSPILQLVEAIPSMSDIPNEPKFELFVGSGYKDHEIVSKNDFDAINHIVRQVGYKLLEHNIGYNIDEMEKNTIFPILNKIFESDFGKKENLSLDELKRRLKWNDRSISPIFFFIGAEIEEISKFNTITYTATFDKFLLEKE